MDIASISFYSGVDEQPVKLKWELILSFRQYPKEELYPIKSFFK